MNDTQTPKKTQKPRSEHTIEQIIKAVTLSDGFLSKSAKRLNITYQALWARMQKHPELKEAVREIQEAQLDFAEGQLHKLIKKKEPSAVYFYLKCKGKERGYIERQEITGAGGGPIALTWLKGENDSDNNPVPAP